MQEKLTKEKTSAIDISLIQSILIKANLDESLCRLRKYSPIDILSGIFYVIKTGCQWASLPKYYPHWKMVYHHFRGLCERKWFDNFLRLLVQTRRCSMGQTPAVSVGIVDSQSIRSGLCDSDKGIDGHKRIKGIKRHVMVDTNGYVLGVNVTTANVHDAKGAVSLVYSVTDGYPHLSVIKADKAYRGLAQLMCGCPDIQIECVKSNYGTDKFIPLDGRWVVERTFSWMESYRRLNRNYERKLTTGMGIFTAACVMFMLRYIR